MRFDDEQAAELGQARVERVGRAAQHGSAIGGAACVPRRKACRQARHHAVDVGWSSLRARRPLERCRSPHRTARARARRPGRHRSSWRARCRTDRAASAARAHRCARSGDASSSLGRHLVIGELVHEGRIGAVLQQPPHQVGQQVAVLAHRRVDAQRQLRVRGQHLAEHALAHAVQALELERRAGLARHLGDRGDRAGVVGRELRIDHVGMADQRACAGQVRDVGVLLVREHRVAGEAEFLCALDLAVPIRALDQAHHELQLVRACDARHFVDYLERTRLVGLDRQAEAPPSRMRACDVRGKAIEHVEREFEAVALFRVDRQVHVGARRRIDERNHARHQLGEHTSALRVLAAREQGRQLDRDAVALERILAAAGLGDGRDRALVRRQVALRIALGARAFAEHVVGKAQRCLLAPLRVSLRHRLADVAAEHELAAEQLDRAHSGGHHGLGAQARDEIAVGLRVGQEFLRQRNRRARQGGQHAVRPFRRIAEIGAAELVGRQRDRRLGVGHAQQRFGQPHQRQALGAGDRVLAQQRLHRPERRRRRAHALDPRRGHGDHRAPVEALQRCQRSIDDTALVSVRVRQSGHGFSWCVIRQTRDPKIALPTRTIVAPSATAASRSALMPIDSVSSAEAAGVAAHPTARAGTGAARAGLRSRPPAPESTSARATSSAAARPRPAPTPAIRPAATPLLLASPLMLTCRHTCSGGRSGRPLLGQALRDLQPVDRVHPVEVAPPPRASCCSAAGRSGATRVAVARPPAPRSWPAPPARSSRRRRAARRHGPARTASASKVLLTASNVTLCTGRPARVRRRRANALPHLLQVVFDARHNAPEPIALTGAHPSMDITQLLAFSVKNKASDLHLSAGLPPMIRVHGDVRRINVDAAGAQAGARHGVRHHERRAAQALRRHAGVRLLASRSRAWRAFASTPSTRTAAPARCSAPFPSKILTLEQLNAPKVFADLALQPARPGAGDRAHRLGQEHHAGGDGQPPERKRVRPRADGRRPDRVRAREQEVPDQPARGRARTR